MEYTCKLDYNKWDKNKRRLCQYISNCNNSMKSILEKKYKLWNNIIQVYNINNCNTLCSVYKIKSISPFNCDIYNHVK